MMLNALKKIIGLKNKTANRTYLDALAIFFNKYDLTINEVEYKLKQVTSAKCLYFESETGQQLEALYFAAISLIKEDAENILEIGTGKGANTVILSVLFPGAKIYTYDLPENDRDYDKLSWRVDDINFSNKINRNNIIFHEKNSFYMLSDNLPYFDLVYVDGGHSYPAIAWDAMFAYNKTNPGGFIIFHDYNRPNNDPNRDANHVKDLIDNYLSKIITEEIIYLPWSGYDTDARTCLIRKI